MYNPGDILLLPVEEEYTGTKFVLENLVTEPQPEQEPKLKKRRKTTSEEEV